MSEIRNPKSEIFFSVFILMMTFLSPAYSSESTYLSTYGSEAKTIEGDDDFVQVIFIRIPEGTKPDAPLYVRIFDADCGGLWDARYTREWNTTTRFRLFGGEGAYSNPGLKKPSPETKDLESGTLLADSSAGEDSLKDNNWFTFAEIHPKDGEKNGEFRYFRVVVQGSGGDDGNRYDIAVVTDLRRTLAPEGLYLFTYEPTVHLPRDDVFAEIRFFVPKDIREITVHNFDLAEAVIAVNTAFRGNLPVATSGQDKWSESIIQLNENESEKLAALRFEGGEEIPNDGTFYVTDKQGEILPIELPVYLQKPNARPEVVVNLELLGECSAFLFNGSRTKDTEGDPLHFSWDFGDGASGEGERITHAYQTPGRYEASVIVSDACGQVFNNVLKKFIVTVNHPPKADAGPDAVAAPGEKVLFDGSASNDPDGKLIAYYWEFGDGNRDKGLQVSHVFRRAGVFISKLRVEDDSGTLCNFAVDEREIWINTPPTVSIGKDRIASVGESLEFVGKNSSDSDGKIVSYEWLMGDGTSKSGLTVTHVYEKPGIYTVTLAVTDDSAAKNSTTRSSLKVFVNDPPVADAGSDQRVSAKESVRFDASKSYDPDGKIISYLWDFGDQSETKEKSEPFISHSYEKPGTYSVMLTVKDDSGSSSDTASEQMRVIVNDPPVADAGEDQWVTAGEVQFDGSGSRDPDGKIISYLWDFGDGSKDEGISPVHVYRNPGAYTISLLVSDDSGTTTARTSDEMTVTVNHLPVADAGPDQIGIPGQVIHFDGSASADPDGKINTFHWDFGDGTEAEGDKVSHSYSRSGRYNVLLTVYDNSGHEGAMSFDEAEVVINQAPVAKIKTPLSLISGQFLIVPGETVRFDADSSYDSDGKIMLYQWEFSDPECGKQYKPSAACTFKNPGIYTVSLTVTDNSGTENSMAWDKAVIRVNHQPRADAGKNIHTNEHTVALDGTGSSDADGDPLTYLWNFGDNSLPGRGEKVFHTYPKGGSYPVILTVDDGTGLGNARSTSAIKVMLNDPPVAKAGDDKTVCAGKVVIFDGVASVDPEGGRLKYHWNFGDSTEAEGVNPTKIYDRGGTYTVTLTVTDDSGLTGGDTGTDRITVRVIESPVADAGADQSVCANTTVQFDGTKSRDQDGVVNYFHWDFGDGKTGSGPTPIHVYNEAGQYRAMLTITGDRVGDCANTHTDEMSVTVYKTPNPEFTCPLTAEPGKPVSFVFNDSEIEEILDTSISQLLGSPSLLQWDWNFGDGKTGQGQNIAHIFEKPGKYYVSLTVTGDSKEECNKASRKKLIIINAPPAADAGEDQIAGVNQVLVFDGSGSKDSDGVIASYLWDFGDAQSEKGVEVRHQYREPGSYQAKLTVTDNTDLPNNTSTDTLTVTVNAPPQPMITLGNSNLAVSKIQVCAGEKAALSAGKSLDPDGEIISHIWNFGDGSPAEKGKELSHVWRSPGTYQLILEVDDGSDLNNSRIQTSALVVVNEPPIVSFISDRVVSPGEDIPFDGSASKDRDGSVVSFQWDFGDGGTARGAKVSHRFTKPGNYPVRLAVTDNSDTSCKTSEQTVNIRVNAAPVADAGGDREAFIGGANDTVLFDAKISRDPDGDTLTFSWDFGDGGKAQGAKVSHRFKKPGTYTVRLRADDGTGLKSSVGQDEITVQVKQR